MGLLSTLKQKVLGISAIDESAFDADFLALYHQCKDFTMTSVERMNALYDAVHYVLDNNIPGDFVECGVWKGGSSLLIALILKEKGITDRKLYMYDTYEGMTEPTADDISLNGEPAKTEFQQKANDDGTSVWCYSALGEVENNLSNSGLNTEQLVFVKGKVEDTIPGTIPTNNIALLRLDTDWYESTKHEMEHLYPKLSKHGVLIIDDYGHWQGAKKAIDEYFVKINLNPLLHRIDYTGRSLIKL